MPTKHWHFNFERLNIEKNVSKVFEDLLPINFSYTVIIHIRVSLGKQYRIILDFV